MKNQNKKGFTLVELVIVIAVIAILAGVLIGTFATVISRANQSKAVQEWKARVDEVYVNYVAEYHVEPTSVSVSGNTITFGNGTETSDVLLLAGTYVELDKDNGVYFNWTNDKSYTVSSKHEGTEAKVTVDVYNKMVADKAGNNGVWDSVSFTAGADTVKTDDGDAKYVGTYDATAHTWTYSQYVYHTDSLTWTISE